MDELRKLVNVIESRGVSEFQLLDPKNKNSKEWQFYELIKHGTIKSEEDAVKLLYSDNESSSGFKMLKSRLRKKLLNNLFFLDFNSSSIPKQHAQELELHSKLYQANALSFSGLDDLAVDILNQIIPLAKKFEFNSILEASYKLLSENYAQLSDKKNFYKVKQAYETLQPIVEAEKLASFEFDSARIELTQSVSSRKTFLQFIDEKLSKLESIWNTYPSYVTFEKYYQFSSWTSELKGDYERIIELTQIVEKLVEVGAINPHRFDIRYNKFIQVFAHLRTKKFKEGLELASLYESYFDVSSSNWFAHMEHYFLLALHSKHYQVARSLIDRVNKNTFITKIKKLSQERWLIYEAYLNIVAPIEGQPLQLQKLLQNLSTYSKDKEGYNVAILILQVIHYLQNIEIEVYVYKVDALKKYAQKHFKDDFSERSRLFFKLLSTVVQVGFDPVLSEKKGEKYLQKLSNTPPPGQGYAELEIVPYEHLWELILLILNQKPIKL